MSKNLLGTRKTFDTPSGKAYYYSLSELEKKRLRNHDQTPLLHQGIAGGGVAGG